MPALSEKFHSDKKHLFSAVETYLKSQPVKKTADLLKRNALDLLKKGDLEKALQQLEIARDARSGIVSSIQGKVLIRDARNCAVPPQRGAEAFLMQFINAISAAKEVAEIERISNLEQNLLRRATSFFDKLRSDMSQEQMAKALQKEIEDLTKFLENKGVDGAAEKLNVARDFQCFNRAHYNVATISEVRGKVVVEAEIAFTELTGEQRQQFESLKTNKKIPAFERALMRRHGDAILSDEHVIPAHKNSLPGVGLFEKVTMLDGEEILSSYHSAAVASLCADKGLRDEMTRQNIHQVKSSIGSNVHLNLLNAKKRPRLLIGKNDPEIVERTTKANGVKSTTTTCVNGFRYFGMSSDLSGAKRYLSDIAKAINPQADFSGKPQTKGLKEIAKIMRDVQTHIAPAGFFGSVKKLFSTSAKKASKALNHINFTGAPQVREILQEAIYLAQKVAKADSMLRMGDAQNASLDVAASLNRLSYLVKKHVNSDKVAPGVDATKLPKDHMVTLCAQGLHRTGIKTQDESARAVARKLDIDVREVDKKLSAASSAGHMAGSVMVGFNSAGNFGIKSENRFVLPSKRKEALSAFIEDSARGVDVKGKGAKQKPSSEGVAEETIAPSKFADSSIQCKSNGRPLSIGPRSVARLYGGPVQSSIIR